MMKRYLFLSLLFAFPAFSFAQKAQDFYKKLYGSIDKYPVVMDLIVMDTACSGWYYYEKQGIPIRIEGQRKNGKITLKEENEQGKVTGTFQGTIDNGSFTGKWIKPAGGELSFDLREDYSHGSVKMIPGLLESNYDAGEEYGYSYMAMYLVAEGNVNKAAENGINEALHGISLNGKPAADAVRKLLEDRVDSSLTDYKRTLQEDLADTSGGFYPFIYNWEEQSFMQVLFNERNLLVIAESNYLYSGGAHGNYGTSNFVFDTGTGKEIKLNQVFQRGYKEMLPKLLEQQFRKIYEVPEVQSLQDFGLFVDRIEPSEENFYITRNGIGFTYVPYEIGPYVAGQIDILLPYSMINDLLDPKGPAGWAVKK